jgi:phage tail-like protein
MATIEEPRKKSSAPVKHHQFQTYTPLHRSSPSAFWFELSIGDLGSAHAAFQEVSGIEVNADIETISEAGLNSYSHRVPKRTSYNNLVLKRGLVIDDSAMMDWVKDSIQNGLNTSGGIKPKQIILSLLGPSDDGASGVPIQSWNFVGAYPVKWSIGALNSTESALTIESIEFAYSYWTFA